MKVIKKTNYRVIVEPKGLGDFGGIRVSDSMFYKTEEERQKQYAARCREIEEEIKRHVDNVGYVSVEFDASEVCSLCGHGWEVSEDDSDPDYPKGTPVCCNAAIDEYRAASIKSVD